MTDITVGKLVEQNKIVGADVFASEKNGSNDVWSGIFRKLSLKWDLINTFYQVQPV